ncbi:MAG: winged helix-turn-helix domain-containing protein [Aeriscardovia sp.]|nr:winged helix-turn-helix domain-containing protein [Aeriscardovia sp.]
MQRRAITAEEYKQIVAAENATQDKKTSRKLRVLILRYEGYDNQTIAERVGISKTRVVHLVGEYFKNGLEEYTRKKYGGNHRNMSVEEEKEILQQFRERAEAGQVIAAKEIKQAFDEKLGRDTGRGYIYMLLDRHKWRKVMPRSRHPKKADDETIEASKKLKAE